MEALLRRRVIIGFILAVLLTGLMGFLSWRSTHLAAQEADLVAHTHAVMGTLDVTVEHAIELETSARGFALTGQDLLLTHYEAARGTINQDFGTLRHLTTDNPNQQRRLDVLEPQIADAIGFADHLVAARQNAHAIPGASEIKQSERVVDAIRGTIQQMQAEETRLLNERSQKTGAARSLTTFVTVAGTLVGAVFLLLAGFAVNREIGVSARARAQVSALNTELEQRAEQRTAAVQSEIAARIATEQKLRASEELFRLLLDGIKDYAVYMLDPEGRVASWNAGAARIKGYQTEEIVGKHFSCFYTAEDQKRGKPQQELREAIASGRFEEEGRRVRKDGSALWANVVITPVYDPVGALRGYSKVVRDITERKLAEEALRESQDRQAGIIGSAMDAIITVDSEQRIVLFNAAAERMFRCPAAEALEQPIERFVPQRFHAVHGEHIRRFGETGTTNRAMGPMSALWAVRADGQEFQIEASISQIVTTERKLFTVILRDVTERKQAEEALRESQAQLTSVIQSAMDAIITVDDQQRVVLFNAAAEKMFRCPAAEALGQPLNHFIPQRFRSQHSEHIRRFGETGVTIRSKGTLGALWALRADGEEFQMEASISQIEARGKKLFTVIMRDVTERKQAEEALRESQAQLTGIIQSATDAILTVDGQQRIVLFNSTAEKMFGCPAQQAVGQPIERFIPQRFRAAHGGHIRRFGETGVTSRAMGTLGSLWALRVNGEEFPIDASISQIEAGGKKLFTVIIRDITERKRTDEALREQAQVLDSAQVFVRDMESRVVFWPRGAEKLYGFNPQEALGIISHDLFHTQFPEPLEMVEKKLFETGMWEGELIHRKRDGSIIVVASAWVLHRNAQGQPARILEVNVDITARKQAEQTLAGQSQELVKQAAEIRKLNDELEQRVVQRTAQLEAANKELEAFTYSVSHDLRAPLRHIGGFSKILVEEFGPALDPTAQHYLQRIEEGTRRMGTLVDELLNLARVGRHSLSLQVTGLNSIVSEVMSMLKPESDGRQVEWIIADLPFVECDPVLIKQVFQNLMANALKFTRPRPRAVVEIGQVEENGNPAIFVRDNGVGFSMKYADKLFGVFQRLHRPEDFEGTGIGLATVQRIIQKHGGRVWVEAELDRGATFYFSLGAREQLEVHGKKEQKDNAAMIGA